ncbi:MAG: hypothetical protein WCB14_16970, partial [Candidatus Acidiferrales bacterium]
SPLATASVVFLFVVILNEVKDLHFGPPPFGPASMPSPPFKSEISAIIPFTQGQGIICGRWIFTYQSNPPIPTGEQSYRSMSRGRGHGDL